MMQSIYYISFNVTCCISSVFHESANCLQQVLEKVSKSPCSEDIAFAKTKEVAKRNRHKDKSPCELYMSSLVLVVVVVN